MQISELDESKMPKVMEIIDRLAVIFDEEDFEGDEEIKSEIAELEKQLIHLTGKNIEECQPFQKYWAYTDLETIAQRILMKAPQKENLLDEELYEIFEDIFEFRKSEAEIEYLIQVLASETGLDDIEDYIYNPDEVGLPLDATGEMIFEKILADRK